MDKFLSQHADVIVGAISCFDRVVFKGYLPISGARSMEGFMAQAGVLIKDFKTFVRQYTDAICSHAQRLADRAGRPYRHLERQIDKDAEVKRIAEHDGITQGLVCVLSAVEGCQSFRSQWGKGRPRLRNAPRKCKCLYFYYIDSEFGLLHVRIQTWFPFTIQICLNGHNALARKLAQHGIGHEQLDNCLLWIEDVQRAQRFADRFVNKNWPRILSALARRVNPLMFTLLRRMDYYLVTDQAEFATDVMFKDRAALQGLYPELTHHATRCFSAEDVLSFLGRKLHGNFQGEVLNDYKKRVPGVRVKHRMKANGIKMYDKLGRVLRIETVINRPYEFRVRRRGTRGGQQIMGWFPMTKGVAHLFRYREVSLTANRHYLDALAGVHDPTPARAALRGLARPVRRAGRSYRGFNPALEQDVRLLRTLMRGEHLIMGWRNRDVRAHLFPHTRHRTERRRQAARVTRLLKRLHVRGLIRKLPRSRRWRVTDKGQLTLATVLKAYHVADTSYPDRRKTA